MLRVPTVSVPKESSLPALFFSSDMGLLPVNGSPDTSSQVHPLPPFLQHRPAESIYPAVGLFVFSS